MKKMEDIVLGHRIKDLRISLGMNQKQFSDSLQTKVSTLSNWENGRNKPNMEKLSKIAELAGITVEELLSTSKKDYALKYALKSLNNILNTKALSQFDEDNSKFVYKYANEILPIIEERLKFLQLSMYSNKDIEKYVDDTINEIVYSTPKDTKELLFDVKLTLTENLKKIYEYYGQEKDSLSVNISNDLNNETVTKVLKILNNTLEEMETVMKDCE